MKKQVINKTEFVQNMGEVYREINSIPITPIDSLDSLINQFYAIMRKYGICQCEWTENGRRGNNAEWCMCYCAFEQNLTSKLTLLFLLSKPPKDLLAYGKEPQRNQKNKK